MKAFLIENNDLQFQIIDSKNATAQRIVNRLKLVLGEFIHTPDEGIDYYSVLGNKSVKPDDIKLLIQNELNKDSEITSINSIEVVFVNTNEKTIDIGKPLRTAILKYDITSIFGQIRGEL